MALALGLMSGTSLDGVDGVLAEFDETTLRPRRTLAHAHRPMPAALHDELLALNARHGSDELHRAAVAALGLMDLYAAVVGDLLDRSAIGAAAVAVIGAHGQTVRHRPAPADGGYTLQLVNGAALAERAGIDVVCDFRSADVAAGGQGAPLVPAFHAACFGRDDRDVVVLNVGGIANLTVLPAAGPVTGFDCGPGNVLLDLWCRRHRGRAYDDGGRWAASGRVDAALLRTFRQEPFFALPPPKSTGRDLFDAAWLEQRLGAAAVAVAPVDVMATLLELTAGTAADAVRAHGGSCRELLVCGGGAANTALMQRLQHLLGAGVVVSSTAAAGVPPDEVEALAFAWLAMCRLRRRPAGLPSVTGAAGARVLGAWYPAPGRG